ncbi:MAG: cell division protein FtsL [Spirochaetales bacterium]|nr:cell division protein FtsL [Spirochaetales bacterium]
MKKIIITLMIFSVPALLFLSVLQSYRYDVLEGDVARLESVQKELFEKNKKTIMGIEYLKSPFRIDKIAGKELNLDKVDGDKVFRIEIERQGNSNDG